MLIEQALLAGGGLGVVEPGTGSHLHAQPQVIDVVSWWASRPVIGDEFDEVLTGEVVTEATVGYGLTKTALHKGAVHVVRRDAASARVGVVRAFAAIVPAECGFGMP